MNKHISIFVFLLFFCQNFISRADNPIVQTYYTSDPAPMVYKDTMFVYVGHDEDNASYYEMNDWRLYSTTDMVNWTDRGCVLSYKDFSWSEPEAAWAAQCVERNGKFYYYVTTIPKEISARSVGVAVADNPAGPFKDAIGKPLLSRSWDYIDPTVYIDGEDAYLYLGNPSLYHVKLNEDMISYSGDVVKHDMTTQSFGSNSEGKSSYTEGPWFYKRNNLYYMVYAAGGIPEHIAYSTSSSPTGPWTYQGIIMKNQGKSFTNHSGIVDFKGRSFFFYHNGALDGGGGFTRSVAVEEFTYNADGTIPQFDMTDLGVKNPIQPLDPYRRQEAETMAFSHGVKTFKDDSRGIYVGNCHAGDYIKIRSVDFGEDGCDKLTFAAQALNSGGSIEVRIDDRTSGTLIGTINIANTNGWKEIAADIDNVTDVHDVYFIFKGDDSELFNLDYWFFETSGVRVPQGPYSGTAISIPGKLEAEDYDLGGSGTAYYDAESKNQGGAYRTDGVDIVEISTGKYAVGYTVTDEWMEYTINVKKTAAYKLTCTVSSGMDNTGFQLFLDDEEITSTITAPNTGDWDTYSTVTANTTQLTAGTHVLKLLITGGYINIDCIEFAEKAASTLPEGVDPNFHIYLAFGQSNMEGNAAVIDANRVKDDRFKVMATVTCSNMGRTLGEWSVAVPPLFRCYTGLSIADYFGKTMIQLLPDVTVGVVPVAIGGTSIKIFDKAQVAEYLPTAADWLQSYAKDYDNRPYDRMVEMAKKAQKDGVIKGIIFHQGETDGGYADWEKTVAKVYNDLITDLDLDPEKVPFIAGEMLENGSCAGMSDRVHKLPNYIKNCAVVSSAGAPGNTDRLHFTNEGYQIMGKRYAELMATMIDLSEPTPQAPFDPDHIIQIPGKLEAENYDTGNAGDAYSDSDRTNEGGEYRTDGVDIVTTTDGYAVGYTLKDEWLEYTVEIQEKANYKVTAKASTTNDNSSILLYLDDEVIADTLHFTNTDDFATYELNEVETKELSQGEHILKVLVTGSYFNLDWLKFEAIGSTGMVATSTTKSSIAAGTYTIHDVAGREWGYIEITEGSMDEVQRKISMTVPQSGVYIIRNGKEILTINIRK